MHVIGAASSFPSLRVSVVDSLASNNNKDPLSTFSNFRGFSSSIVIKHHQEQDLWVKV